VEEKILLALLPFWDPQIPPLGIACLKSYLQSHNFQVKTYDANIEIEFRNLFDDYFGILKKMIPPDKHSNLFNIGNQVLRNHMMAHQNNTDEIMYLKLRRILIENTFFTKTEEGLLNQADEILETFYSQLKGYILNLLERESPTVLGLSVYGDTLSASLAAFKIAKKWNPSIKTVMGGGIFSDQMALGSPNLDYFVDRTKGIIDSIIIGEGEELFLQFLKNKHDKSKRVYTFKDLDSSFPSLSIESLEIPDFSDFDLNFYPHLAHYGARSCPYQCKFCSETVNWGKYRKKNVHQTVNEFIQLYETYSLQLFLMTDSTLNPIITDLSNAFIESQIAIYWDGFLRADRHVCDQKNTLLWRRGGFYRAKLGMESGSQRLLKLMNKQITIEQSRKALASLANAGIKTTTFWLFGFPGETEEDFQKTLDFIEECQDNIYEADCNAFNYYLTGQANSEDWSHKNKSLRLYPQWAKEMLITETWILDIEPSREIAYSRLNRFIQHCTKLGIPNPYSLNELYKADQRWKNLHKNAVPLLVELKNPNTYIDERQNVKDFVPANQKTLENESFDF